MSVISEAISPPAISFIITAALFSTFTVLLISTPFSKRVAASVRNPCRKDVVRILAGLNQALSKKIFFVAVVTPLCTPPYTPAMHMASVSLQITRSSADNFLSLLSNVVKGVPSGKFFIITLLPVIISASKACKGCPVSCKIKLVISTILLMGRRPMLFNFCCNHLGLSAIVIPRMLTPAYRSHAALFSIITSTGNPCLSGLKVFLKGDFTWVFFFV